MHELAICQSLIREVERVAAENRALAVSSVIVAVGPLSGVDGGLLARAFAIARAGTRAAGATLELEAVPVAVHCAECGLETPASANELLCGRCGSWRVALASGDELLLRRIELEVEAECADRYEGAVESAGAAEAS